MYEQLQGILVITNVQYHFSYFLYNISHPNKYGVPQIDLSTEKMPTLQQESLTNNQLLVKRVICKTFFAHYHCDVVITDCIRFLFTSKLSRMGKAMYNMGGRENQIQKWKVTEWTINLHSNKIVPETTKRKTENVFVQSQAKRIAQLEEDLESSRQTLKATTLQLQRVENTNKQLVASLGPHEPNHGMSTVHNTKGNKLKNYFQSVIMAPCSRSKTASPWK